MLAYPLVIANPSGLCPGYQLIQTAGPTLPATAPNGSYFVQFTAQGLDANQMVISSAYCSFTVHLIKDIQAPVFTYCPPNITIYGIDDGTGNCSAQAFWSNPTSTDNCDMSTLSAGSHPCGSTFQNGTTTVTYTATDNSNNSSTCSFTVTVSCINSSSEMDNPSLSCTISPNPTTGQLGIAFNGFTSQTCELQIIDLWGRIVQTETISSGTQEHILSLTDLPSGVYFVKVMEKGQSIWIEKIVKQ
jgi:hypothetical protein